MASYTVRDLLERIERNGGPAGLDLARADLAELDAGPEALAAELAQAQAADPAAQPAWFWPATGGLNLEGADLERATLAGAQLQGANLRGTNLERAVLEGCGLENAVLVRADLERARLRGAHLAGADLQQANLERAHLSQAELQGAGLQSANLERADLQGANLSAADLQAAHLEGANLQEVDLSQGNLRRVNLEGANLRAANLSHADLEQGNLEGADLRAANLQGANLRGANLEGARLCDADLTQACLADANLAEANLEGADLQGADLSGAHLDDRQRSTGDRWGDPDEVWMDGSELGARLRREAGDVVARVAEGMSAAAEAAREASAAAAGAFHEAGEWSDLETGGEGEFSISIPLEQATGLRLDLGLGNVELAAGEGDDILLRGRGRQGDLETIRAGGTVHIRQRRPDRQAHWFGFGRQRRLNLTVTVPASLQRLNVRTGLGNLEGRDLRLEGSLVSGKGDVRLTGGHLQGKVATGLGGIELVGVSGVVNVRSGCGQVRAEDVQGRLEISTGHGRLELRNGRLERLQARTGAGDITASLAIGSGDYRCESGAGVISVEVLGEPSMQVEAVTGMGQVRSDWPLVRVGRPGPVTAGSTRMVGSIGDETRRGRLHLRTGLGNIHLHRGPALPDLESSIAAEPATAAPEPPQPPVEEPAATVSGADARLAILASLARGEITVDEAEEMILHLADDEQSQA